MKMRIVQGATCSECGKAPASERWSINRTMKTVQRHVLCGLHGKGLAKMKPMKPKAVEECLDQIAAEET